MAKDKLRLTVHAAPNGLIRGIVAQPDGKISANLVPEAGTFVSELADHEIAQDTDREQLFRLAEQYSVETVPARSKLVDRKSHDD